MECSSYELEDFNLKAAIKLSSIAGMIKICRSEDGKLILVCDSTYQLIDYSGEALAKIADTDAVLAFALDVGIRKIRRLTYDGGFYFGTSILPSSHGKRPREQKDLDNELLEKAIKRINDDFQSGDQTKELAAITLNHLFQSYNEARLLFPDFFNDSYLALMRIIDASTRSRRGRGFASGAASVSPSLNKKIFDAISLVQTFSDRLRIAEEIFNDELQTAKKSKDRAEKQEAIQMEALDDAGRFVFSCLFSAYKYRNEFVHYGLPFPNNLSAGDHYLSFALGMSFLRRHSTEGSQPEDYLDIHEVVSKPDEIDDFKNKYFLLLPSWDFMRLLTREALLKQI